VEEQRLVLVESGAEWCSLCVALMPTLQNLAKAYEDKVTGVIIKWRPVEPSTGA
jgi:thiol-disulfide isomerase/thioredoxin